MATSRGGPEVRRYIAGIGPAMQTDVLRGAARAAATIVADEAKLRSISAEVSASIKVATKREEGRIIAKVQTRGSGAYIAPWLEYGTAPHLISVDQSQSGGRSVGRINRLAKGSDRSHSLVIGGNFVGATVMHPGARPHPFMRPALDSKEREAIAAAQAYINTRVTRAGIVGSSEPEGGDE